MISFSKKYTKSIFILVIFLIGLSSWSQNILISQGGTVNVSGGEIFYDAGGVAGNDGNTNYTITLCPSNPGEKVCLNFSYFKTYFSGSGEDALFIYDGNTVTLGTDIGKLIKQLSATDDREGWDGTYNQELLPSTDYWFSLDYTEIGVAKTFKAHFSLIR